MLALLISALLAPPLSGAETTLGTALVRRPPVVNGGARVEGSIQQMTGANVTFNGGATITGDLLTPGLPTVRLNGNPAYAGTIDLDGAETPAGYRVTLNGSVTLRNVVRRVDPFALPAVAAPLPPGGNRSVTINSQGGTAGDWSTVRNLTLNGNAGQHAVPPGAYGNFSANGGSGFTLGVAGASEPAVYHFQRLTLNGQTRVELVGPVVVTVAFGFTANGLVGSENEPSWLKLGIHSGGFTLNGGCSVFGHVASPAGTTIINGNSRLEGGLVCDRLIVNGGGLLRLYEESSNEPPVAFSQSLVGETDVDLAVVLTGSDPEEEPLTFTLETGPAHGVLFTAAGAIISFPAELPSPSLIFSPAPDYAGPDQFSFHVSDGELLSDPATITILVERPAQPPEGVADVYQVNEGSVLSVPAPGVLENDSNPSGGDLTAEQTAPPAGGVLALQPSGAFVYTPNAGFHGADSFSYRPKSDGLTGAPATVSIHVNARPRPVDRSLTTARNTAVDVPLSADDPDHANLTHTIATAPAHGVLSGNSETGWRYVPGFNFSGQDTLTFLATDPLGAEAVGTVTITVVPENVPPVVRAIAASDAAAAPFLVSFDGSSSYDTDGQIVRFQWDLDNDGAFDAEGPAPRHTFNSGGDHTVRLRVTDDKGATSSLIHAFHLNLPPSAVITVPQTGRSFTEGGPVQVRMEAADVDGPVVTTELWIDGEAFATAPSAWAEFALNDPAVGAHELTARVVDDRGAVGWSAPVTISVTPSLASAGNFVVHPSLRVAELPAARGAASGGGEANSTTLPLHADNFFGEPVDYGATVIGDRTDARTGYLVLDSAATSEAAYAWEEIGYTGVKLPVTHFEDGFSEVRLSFAFPFFDQTFDRLFVGSNGLLTFQEGSSRPDNESLPAPTAPGYLIAPFWTDLEPGYEFGGGYDGGGIENASAIYAQDFGDRVVIQYSADLDFWNPPVLDSAGEPEADEVSDFDGPQPEDGSGLMGVPHFNRTGRYTFQVVLYQNGDIDLVYRWMDGATNLATIGIQNAEATDGVQLAFNAPFVSNHRTISLRRESRGDPWFSLEGVDGSLSPGGHDDMTVRFTAAPDFAPGDYRGQIRFDHTQPGLPPYIIDVGLAIYARDPRVRFQNPEPGGRQYFLVGETIPVTIEATDEDGVVRAVSLLDNDSELAFWTTGPFAHAWTPPAGAHELIATAIDNDGRVGESAPLLISVSGDSDDDGLPDAFEMDHFGSLWRDGFDDPDDDGWTNRKELVYGADPNIIDLGTPPNAAPVARLATMRLSGEAPFVVEFDGRGSTDADSEIVEWEWDFDGDGNPDEWDSVVEHTFSTPGVYAIRLTVHDEEGASGTTTVPVRVRPAGTSVPPQARFEASLYAAPAARSIAFDASDSIDPDGAIASHQWSFGDGGFSDLAAPARYFDRAGIYAVRLTVTDEDGLSAATEKYITITARDEDVFIEQNGRLVVEAEHATQYDARNDVQAWRIMSGSGAPNTWGVSLEDASEETAFRFADPPAGLASWQTAAGIGWRVRITTPGIYYYAVRCYNANPLEALPAIRIGVDNIESTPPAGDSMAFTGDQARPHWLRGVPLGFLGAGDHTIQIRRGQGRLWIDQLAIATDKEALPADQSTGPALFAAVRAHAPSPAPAAVIDQTVHSASLPFRATFDATGSRAARGAIAGYNWRVLRTLDPGDGSLADYSDATVSDQPALTLEIDDFNPVFGGFSDDGVGIELLVHDELGQLASASTRVVFSDPLEELVSGAGIVIDDESPAFTASDNWHISTAKNFFAFGRYFPGGLEEARRELQVPPTAIIYSREMEQRDMIGSGARLIYRDDPGDRARFALEVPESGRYLVFVRWPRHSFGAGPLELTGAFAGQPNPFGHPVATAAAVTVEDADGSVDYLFDQRVGGHWRFAGVHRFASGTAGALTIGNSIEGEMVLADAVMLYPVPASAGNAAPVASFTSQVRADRTVAFDGTASVDPDGAILAWFWTFGDGTTSRGSTPVHRYKAPGSHAVTLTVLDAQLGWRVQTATVEAPAPPANNAAPVARFSIDASRGRAPFVVQCDGAASTDDQAVARYRWGTHLRDEPWGGGGDFIAEGANASFVLNAPGHYDITLTVTDAHGLSDTLTLPVEVVPAGVSTQPPLVLDNRDPGFSTTGAWIEQPASVRPELRPFIHGPDFLEAGEVGAEARFQPALPHAGLYQVWLRHPVAAVEPPLDVRVVHEGGESRVALNHAYRAGEWRLLGTFRFEAGSSGWISFAREREGQVVCADAARWAPVDAAPRADFNINLTQPARAPAPASFDASPSSPGTGIAAFEWDFGDGGSASGPEVSHLFTGAGTFAVRLTVRDERGTADSATRLVRIEPPLTPPTVVAEVQPAAGASPLTIAFDASASNDAEGIDSVLWSFGDGTSTAASAGLHRFDRAGTFEVVVTVVDSRGATAQSSFTVEVQPAQVRVTPGVAALPSATIPRRVGFTAGGAVGGDTVSWDFGDGTTGAGASIEHEYSAAGTYLVQLTITRDGRPETTQRWVAVGEEIDPSPPPDGPYSDPGAALILYTPLPRP
ncbi:MAG: PKD domain-containing protein [Opitutaceae bacterium]